MLYHHHQGRLRDMLYLHHQERLRDMLCLHHQGRLRYTLYLHHQEHFTDLLCLHRQVIFIPECRSWVVLWKVNILFRIDRNALFASVKV